MIKFKRKDLDIAWGIKLNKDLDYEIIVPNKRAVVVLYPFLLIVVFIVGMIATPIVWYKQFVGERRGE